ncbi:MAG TPA: penicillin-binding transpeptidase domain-containing protein [Acidimicrobiia bacterium]|nr:penicillin-binding transpeptidase domain-containing protein [Acidimicrobiia bacterium]
MKPAIRPLAYTLLGLLGFAGLWLTWTQAQAGAQYRDDPRNVRAFQPPVDSSRGRIVTADGVVLAEDAPDGSRRYPEGAAYAHLVGFDTEAERRGIERTRFGAMTSRDDGSITSWLLGLLGADLGPPDVRLTIVDEVQQAARDALGGRTGAVIALDPRTGAVLAYVSSPSFDPNEIVDGSLDPDDGDTENALHDRVADRVLPPGSTFKVLVTAAGLQAGLVPGSEVQAGDSYTPPGGGMPIRNAGDGGCGGDTVSLTQALVVSCNTAFARLTVDLGARRIVDMAEAAGFNRAIPWETGAVLSSIPVASSLDADPPSLAQSGIGERDVRTTPLLMALVASAIANDGLAMAPYVVDRVMSPEGEVLDETAPRTLHRLVPAGTAMEIAGMMMEVVERGTGGPAAIPGVGIAAKTGTAEGSGGPHAWIIAFGPTEEPTIAVAVVVEGGGSGGQVAGPVARAVIAAWLAIDD